LPRSSEPGDAKAGTIQEVDQECKIIIEAMQAEKPISQEPPESRRDNPSRSCPGEGEENTAKDLPSLLAPYLQSHCKFTYL
jgi:hypothetical protein